MRQTLAVLNLKGGSGKTSIAVHLAAVLATERRRVALVDTDPQRSATRWAEWGAELPFPVYPVDAEKGPARYRAALEQIDADLVVIDTPPELETASMLAALVAALVLIPCSPGALDLWATEAAVRMAREARQERGGRLPLVSMIPSRVISRTTLGKQLPDALKAIGEPVGPPIGQRVAVAQASIEGGTARPSSPAGQEFQALARHVLNRLRRI